jgi:hypothetical protein
MFRYIKYQIQRAWITLPENWSSGLERLWGTHLDAKDRLRLFSKKILSTYKNVLCHNVKYHNLNNHRFEKPTKSYKVKKETYVKINLKLKIVERTWVLYR